MRLEAGAPAGVLNVINGDKESVDYLVEDPRVAGINFVGSSAVAGAVYAKATAAGKRAQCFGGAKNHLIVMPDADLKSAANQAMGAAYGSAGERCMAVSVLVAVGDETADKLIGLLKPQVEALRIGPSLDEGVEMGPLVTAAHRNRVRRYIDMAVQEGQELVVDGRERVVSGYEKGFFMGGTLLDKARPEHKSYNDEIFGPVLQIVRVDSLEEAIRLPSEHQYGNGAVIYTRDGGTAREFMQKVQIGMVGINVPIPVPVSYYSFGGWKRSAFGDTNHYGEEGVRFWTKVKTVTQRWPDTTQTSDYAIPTAR